MKVNMFNTIDASNVPSKLSLRDPFDGEIIVDENGDTLDIFVYGVKSDVSRNAMRVRDRKYGKESKLDDDTAAQSGAEYLAAITYNWSGNIENDDGPIVFKNANAIQLYKDQDWISKQVMTHSMNLANYDPKRSSTSTSGSVASPGSTPRRKVPAKREGNTTPE